MPTLKPVTVVSRSSLPVNTVTTQPPNSSESPTQEGSVAVSNAVTNAHPNLSVSTHHMTVSQILIASAMKKSSFRRVESMVKDLEAEEKKAESLETTNSHSNKIPSHLLLQSCLKKPQKLVNAMANAKSNDNSAMTLKRSLTSITHEREKIPRLSLVSPSEKNLPNSIANASQSNPDILDNPVNTDKKAKKKGGKKDPSKRKGCWGKWTHKEHDIFLEGLSKYGKSWSKISAMIKTRTVPQTRSHAQKYFIKLQKDLEELERRKNSGHSSVTQEGETKRSRGMKLSIDECMKYQYLLPQPPTKPKTSIKINRCHKQSTALKPPIQNLEAKTDGREQPRLQGLQNVQMTNSIDGGRRQNDKATNLEQNVVHYREEKRLGETHIDKSMELQKTRRQREIAILQVNEIRREIELARRRAVEKDALKEAARINMEIEKGQKKNEVSNAVTSGTGQCMQVSANYGTHNPNSTRPSSEAQPEGSMMTQPTNVVLQYPSSSSSIPAPVVAPQIQITLPENNTPSEAIPVAGTVTGGNTGAAGAPLIGYVVLPSQPQYLIVNQSGQLQQVQLLQTQTQTQPQLLQTQTQPQLLQTQTQPQLLQTQTQPQLLQTQPQFFTDQYGQVTSGGQLHQIGQMNTSGLMGGSQIPFVTTAQQTLVAANPISVGITAGQIPVGVANSQIPGAINSPFSVGFTGNQNPGVVTNANHQQQQYYTQPLEMGNPMSGTQFGQEPPWQTFSRDIHGDSDEGDM